jgi:DcmR-like sensory protein
MHTTTRPIRIAGRDIGDHRHLCALFTSPTEEYRVLVPFIRDALERGERVVHGVARDQRQAHLARLGKEGIDVNQVESSGQLEMRDSEDCYLPGGEFDTEAMLGLIREMLEDGSARGFPLTRVMAHPECVFDSWRDTNNFLQYEARLNFLMAHYRDPVVCLYDCDKINAGVLMDILRTHRLVIINEVVQENPFYVPPEDFLRELEARNGPQGSSAGTSV